MSQVSCNHPSETQSGHRTQPGLLCTRRTRLKMSAIVSYSKSIYCPCSPLTEDCKGQRASPSTFKLLTKSAPHSACKIFQEMVFVLHLFSRGISDLALEGIFVGRALKLGKNCYWKKREKSRSSFTKCVFAVKILPNIVFWGSQNYSNLAGYSHD